MASCGFEKDLGNGLKTGIVGLALGALGWLIFGAIKSGRSYSSTRQYGQEQQRPQFPPRDKGRRR
jgi:hypothetical protein